MRKKCIDLFCGAGGAAMGLHLAGFEVFGWDIQPNLSYPFDRHVGNALDADLNDFDFAWASPPCQAHSALRHRTGKQYADFISATRDKLAGWGGPYIIENVPGAPLRNPIRLCGSAFGLQVRRHRLFESNMALFGSTCNHTSQPKPIDVSGTGGPMKAPRKKPNGGRSRKPKNLAEARKIMGMPWASRREISQAIPPTYAEYLGRQVLEIL